MPKGIDSKTGLGKSNKHLYRAVLKLDKKLNVRATYVSLTEAANATETIIGVKAASAMTAISRCLNGDRVFAYGSAWRYKDGLISLNFVKRRDGTLKRLKKKVDYHTRLLKKYGDLYEKTKEAYYG